MFKFKHSNNKHFCKIVCLLITMAITCSNLFAIPVFAETVNTTDSNWTIINENDEDYEKALSVLGIAKEEAKNYNLYSVPLKCDTNSTRDIASTSPESYRKWNEFTFYTSNIGSYWTCDGNQLKWGFTWYCTNGFNSGQYLEVQLYEYPNTYINSSGYTYAGFNYTSDWLSSNYCDYRFKYRTAVYAEPSTVAYATVQIFAATRNV